MPMQKIIEPGLTLVVVGAALAFGGVQPLAYSLMQVGVFLLLLLLLFNQVRSGKVELPLSVWPLLFVLVVVMQLVPLPASLVEILSPARALPAGWAPGMSSESSWMTLSINSHGTTLVLLKFLAYLGAFTLAACLFDSRRKKSLLIHALVFLGCFQAAYGIVQYLTGWQKIFTYEKIYYLNEATGTYINRNHFAGLLELTLPFVAALAFYAYQSWEEERGRRSGRRDQGRPASLGFRALFYLFLAVVMVVALIFSRSRMGILAMLFGLICMALLAQVRLRQTRWMVIVASFLIVVGSYGVWIGLGPVLARFEQMGDPTYLEMEGRLSMWRGTVELIRDYPIAGTGLGTFDLAFRRYQTANLDKYVDHAHNDYLQFAAETGLLGFVLLFVPILYLLGRMVSSFLTDTRRYRRAVTLGCIGSTLALLAHSFADFNLQIPANALIFAIVLGIGYKAAILERHGEQADSLRLIPEGAREENGISIHRRAVGSH